MSKLHDAVIDIITSTGRSSGLQLDVGDHPPAQRHTAPAAAPPQSEAAPASTNAGPAPTANDNEVAGFRITSPYGKMRDVFNTGTKKQHHGTDIGTPTGTPVYAPFNGKVTVSKLSQSAGNMIIVTDVSSDGTTHQVTVMHLNERRVAAGESVRAGQLIGFTGNTGRSEAPHLHIEYKVDHTRRDPPRQIMERVLRSAFPQEK